MFKVVVTVVAVVIVVAIQRQRAARACAKQVTVGGRGGDDSGRAFATDVAVQTDHAIRGRHDHVQFVADHQNRTADIITQGFDKAIKRSQCRLIEALGRFVEHKDLRVTQNRARQQHALKLTTGQRGKLPFFRGVYASSGQCRAHFRHRHTNRKVQEPPHSHRQRRIDMQLLGHVVDAQIWRAGDRAFARCECAKQRPQKRRFTRPVRTDNGDNLTGLNGEGHTKDRPRRTVANGRHSWHARQMPVASTVVRSI
jgi:hypothetical protein